MKKIVIASLFLLSFFINRTSAQEAGEPKKKGWPSAERYAFITECIKSAKAGMSEDSAKSYCYCMQEKIEKKYPTIEAAAKITSIEMESPEWNKDVQSCLINISVWTSKDRLGFLAECVGAAKPDMSEEKAKIYCECMMFKIEKKYPNPVDAASMTDETLQSPDWKKMIQHCLDF